MKTVHGTFHKLVCFCAAQNRYSSAYVLTLSVDWLASYIHPKQLVAGLKQAPRATWNTGEPLQLDFAAATLLTEHALQKAAKDSQPEPANLTFGACLGHINTRWAEQRACVPVSRSTHQLSPGSAQTLQQRPSPWPPGPSPHPRPAVPSQFGAEIWRAEPLVRVV